MSDDITKSFAVEEAKNVRSGARIKVIGVGGGGGNMVNHIKREGLMEKGSMKNINIIAANTDEQALKDSLATSKIQLGPNKTHGLGAGMVPSVGRESALESIDEIKDMLKGSDIVFIAAGFGGGTGTGASPVVAQVAKDCGALAVAVITLPFRFEGKKRRLFAENGISELKKECDAILVISNDKLQSVAPKNLGFKDSFKIVDNVLAQAVSGMSAIILHHGKSDINLDFADVRTVMSHRGLALMCVGEARGEGAPDEAVKNALQSPILDDTNIDGAKGIIVNYKFHPTATSMQDVQASMELIHDRVDEMADIFFGTMTDENMEEGLVEVTIIATGFLDEEEKTEVFLETSSQNSQKTEAQESILRQMIVNADVNEINEDMLDKPSITIFMKD